MTSLDPAAFPPPTVTYLNLIPANGERGDGYLDAETMQSLHEAIQTGVFMLDDSWQEPLVKAETAELERRFLERLRSSPLGEMTPVLHHRRLALFEAMREIGSTGTIPGFGFGVHNLTRSLGNLDTWLEGKRQELSHLELNDPEVMRRLIVLTPKQLAALLQVSEAVLANWRGDNRGPAFATHGSRTIRYPYMTVLAWLMEGLARV